MDVSFELDEERGVHSILPVLTSICKLGSSAPSLEVSVPKQPCQGKAAPSMGRQGWMDGDTSEWLSPTPLLPPAPCMNPDTLLCSAGHSGRDTRRLNHTKLVFPVQEQSPKKDLASRVHVCNEHSVVLEV